MELNSTTDDFKPIPSCPGYMVSREGNVRGKRKQLKLFEINGYLLFTYSNNGLAKNIQVHRAVCEVFLGMSHKSVDHINGNRKDNRIENLRYVTAKENYSNSVRLKTNCQGERHGCSKLTESQVVFIKSNYRRITHNSSNKKELAKMFDVSTHTISSIIYGRNWKSLEAKESK